MSEPRPQDLPAEDARAMLQQLGEITRRLDEALAVVPKLPPDARRAVHARLAGKARGFYFVREFAAVIGRKPRYVSDRCAVSAIRTLPGGKPFRIPLSEEGVWNQS